MFVQTPNPCGEKKVITITLDPRLPFPDSVGGIFLVQPLLKKSTRVLNGFPAGGTPLIDSFEHVD